MVDEGQSQAGSTPNGANGGPPPLRTGRMLGRRDFRRPTPAPQPGNPNFQNDPNTAQHPGSANPPLDPRRQRPGGPVFTGRLPANNRPLNGNPPESGVAGGLPLGPGPTGRFIQPINQPNSRPSNPPTHQPPANQRPYPAQTGAMRRPPSSVFMRGPAPSGIQNQPPSRPPSTQIRPPSQANMRPPPSPSGSLPRGPLTQRLQPNRPPSSVIYPPGHTPSLSTPQNQPGGSQIGQAAAAMLRRPGPPNAPTQQNNQQPQPNPASAPTSPTNARVNMLEQELKQLRDEKAGLLKSLRDKEHLLAERDKQHKVTLSAHTEAFTKSSQELNAQIAELKQQLATGNETKNETKTALKKVQHELERAKSQTEALEKSLQESRIRAAQVEAQKKKLLRDQQEKVSNQSKATKAQGEELSDLRERLKVAESQINTLEKSNKLYIARLEQKEKEHRQETAKVKRVSQHAMRSAVLRAEERKRETIAYHQEQARLLERELRHVKEDYDKRIKTERDEFQRRGQKFGEEQSRMKRELAVSQSEAKQLRKLWKQAQQKLEEQEQLAKKQQAELNNNEVQELEAEIAKLRKESRLAKIELRTNRLKTTRLEKLLNDQQKDSQMLLESVQSQLNSTLRELEDKQDHIQTLEAIREATEYSKDLETETLRETEARLLKLETNFRIEQGRIKERHSKERRRLEGQLEVWRKRAEALAESREGSQEASDTQMQLNALFKTEEEQQNMQNQVAALEARVQDLQSQLITAENRKSELRKQLKTERLRVQETEKQLVARADDDANQASVVTRLQEQILELEQAREQADFNIDELNNVISTKEQELEALKTEHADLSDRIKAQQQAALEHSAKLENDNVELRTTVEELEQQLQASSESNEELKSKLEEAQRATEAALSDAINAERDELTEKHHLELNELKSTIDDLQNQLTQAVSARETAEKDLQAAVAATDETAAQLSQALAIQDQLAAERSALESEYEELQSTLETQRANSDAATIELEQLKDQIQGLTAEKSQLEETLNTERERFAAELEALNTANADLNESVESQSAQSLELTHQLETALAEQQSAAAKLSEYETKLAELEAVATEKDALTQTLATLTQEFDSQRQSNEDLASELAETRTALELAQQRADELEAELTDIGSNRDLLAVELENLKTIGAELEEVQNERRLLKLQLSDIEQIQSQASETIEQLESERDQLKTRVHELTEAQQQLDTEYLAANARYANLSADFQESREQLELLNIDNNRLLETVEQQNLRLAANATEFGEREQSLASEIKSQQDTIRELNTALAELKADSELQQNAWLKQQQQLQIQISKLRETSSNDELVAVKQENDSLRAELLEVLEEINERNQQILVPTSEMIDQLEEIKQMAQSHFDGLKLPTPEVIEPAAETPVEESPLAAQEREQNQLIESLQTRLKLAEDKLQQLDFGPQWPSSTTHVFHQIFEAKEPHKAEALRVYSRLRHSLQNQLAQPETLTTLCRRLAHNWHGYPGNHEPMAEPVKTVERLQSLLERLSQLDLLLADDEQYLLHELGLSLQQERQRINSFLANREETLASLSRGTQDVGVLAYLAELSIMDRRIGSELLRLHLCIELIEAILTRSVPHVKTQALTLPTLNAEDDSPAK